MGTMRRPMETSMGPANQHGPEHTAPAPSLLSRVGAELAAHLRHQRLDDDERQLGEGRLQDREDDHRRHHAPVAHDSVPDPAQQRLDVSTVLLGLRHGPRS